MPSDSHARLPVSALVIPLESHNAVAFHCGKGVDHVTAQTGINIFSNKPPRARAILGPVGVVTHSQRVSCLKYRNPSLRLLDATGSIAMISMLSLVL